MSYFDFIVKHQEELDIQGICQNPNLTFEMIKEHYGFLKELIKLQYSSVHNNIPHGLDGGLALFISLNPNIPLSYIIENICEGDSLGTGTNLVFLRKCISWECISKRLSLDDFRNYKDQLQVSWNYIELFETMTLDKLRECKDLWFENYCLSNNHNLTVEFIRENIDAIWNWPELCMNPALTIEDLYSLKEYTILTEIDDEGNEFERWKYPDISSNPNLKWNEPLPEGIPEIEPNLVYCQVDFDQLDIDSLNRVQITNLSWNKKLPIELVLNHPEKEWDYHAICQNGNYPLKELLKIPNVVFYSRALSYNPNVHWTDIERYPFIHWNFQGMAWNKHNGTYILHSQKYIIFKWITDKHTGYFKRMAMWLAYQVKESWWSPENKITTKLRSNAFKLGSLLENY